jgi:hypothetical protein
MHDEHSGEPTLEYKAEVLRDVARHMCAAAAKIGGGELARALERNGERLLGSAAKLEARGRR